MPDYDFKQLSPHDFEQLSRDLIQERDGTTLESFKTGRDDGIDFRYAQGKDKLIVQCKHYAGTGWDGLFRDLKKETAKVAKLKPSRYILVTSVGLSPQNKADIQVLFGDVLATGDILGRDDINNLLGLHSAIEEKHYKLWLASRAVLDRVTHNASVVQSEFEVERVHRDIKRYVQNDAYPRARKMLTDDHVAIISGPPGVGKSTLAKMLLYAYVSNGFEAVSILTDFQTGREMYQRGKKQIFYFDDFIGATFLGERASAFTRNEDRAILDFIELVRGSPTTRLVMTTREHILMQAIAASEKLKHSNLIDSRCVLEIRDYSVGQRAQILYNHIGFSDLPDEYRAALLSNRFYHEIVKHKKFNPRLVEWLSTFSRVRSVEPDCYQDFVRKLLADPSEIWRHAYERQISEAARSVLLALYTYSGKCGADQLERAFQSLQSLRAQRYSFRTSPSDWRSALAELHGSFIRPGNQIEVIDPSVLDMLNAVVRLDMPNSLDMIEGAVRFEQARRVWNFARAEAAEVLGYLTAESDRVAAAFERLLSAPRKKPMNGGVVYFDDSTEIRVGTLLEVAEAIRSERLSSLAVVCVENLLAEWETAHFDISDGIALLSKVGSSKLQFGQSNEAMQKRIVSALTYEASTGCRSDELRDLLSAVDADKLDPEQKDMLHEAAEVYLRDHFSDELRNCGSESELSGLEEDLEIIGNRTKVNLEAHVHAVRQARDELEENQAAHDEQRFDEWKEHRYDVKAADRAIDDLFDSLRNSG
jgi:hypothetical protein